MQVKAILRSVFVLLLMLIISSITISAQEENLLENPGFESGFNSSGVANGWVSWVADGTDAPGFQEAPTFLPATSASDNGLISQVRSGVNAQALFSFFATHDAGVYQQVSSITPGTELRFSIYAHVFSNNLADVDQSANPGGVTIRVGIDPNGGTDPFSSDVVYTEVLITYDTFIQYPKIVVAESDTVTVFVRSTITEPVQNTIVFLDDAVLNITPESSVPAETEEVVTEEPVETEEVQVKDPTPTREGESDATEEVATEEPVETEEVVTEEPVETEEVVTEEPVETEEVVTEEPVETEEAATEEPVETEEAPISETFPGTITHTVRSGDTVGRLAERYGSSTQAIIQANGLDDSALIFVGQGLIIPVRIVPATETPSPTPVVIVVTATPGGVSGNNGGNGTYTVAVGDTLSSIARQFNTTVGALVQLNGIANPNRILVGQELTLPGTGGSEEPVETEEAPVVEETEGKSVV